MTCPSGGSQYMQYRHVQSQKLRKHLVQTEQELQSTGVALDEHS